MATIRDLDDVFVPEIEIYLSDIDLSSASTQEVLDLMTCAAESARHGPAVQEWARKLISQDLTSVSDAIDLLVSAIGFPEGHPSIGSIYSAISQVANIAVQLKECEE